MSEDRTSFKWAGWLLWYEFRDQIAEGVPSFAQLDACDAMRFVEIVLQRFETGQPVSIKEFWQMRDDFLKDPDQ